MRDVRLPQWIRLPRWIQWLPLASRPLIGLSFGRSRGWPTGLAMFGVYAFLFGARLFIAWPRVDDFDRSHPALSAAIAGAVGVLVVGPMFALLSGASLLGCFGIAACLMAVTGAMSYLFRHRLGT